MIKQTRETNNLLFSNKYYDAAIRLSRSNTDLKYTRDPLRRFVMMKEYDEAVADMEAAVNVREENLDKLFAACAQVGIDEIFIGASELVTAMPEKSTTLIWKVKDLVVGWYAGDHHTSYAAGCGNSNQTQVQNSKGYLPVEWLNKAWDVKTRSEIGIDKFKKYMVVHRMHSIPELA